MQGRNSSHLVARLLDGDLLAGVSSSLGYDQGEDAVLKAGLDVLLVDARWESKGAVEFAHGALADPEARLVVLLLDHFLALTLCLLGFAGFRGVVFALGAALDHKSLRVGELNVDVLLRDAREFTVEVVGIVGLADVEARSEGAHAGHLTTALAVGVVVVQKTEERGEVSSGRHGSEERHFGCVLR